MSYVDLGVDNVKWGKAYARQNFMINEMSEISILMMSSVSFFVLFFVSNIGIYKKGTSEKVRQLCKNPVEKIPAVNFTA